MTSWLKNSAQICNENKIGLHEKLPLRRVHQKRGNQVQVCTENRDGFTDVGDQLRSMYWQHFEVLKEGKKITHYRCKHCGPDAPKKEYCGNTSNLRAHLLHAHKDVVVAAKGADLSKDQSQESSTKRGSIDAMIPQASENTRGYSLCYSAPTKGLNPLFKQGDI
ncbi:hypothetical protein CYMTET_46979 [Cymbomonas tetramitiformis]|uniref:BED-type domain-containing protein n=1 Tax=Cymbomonas tetramitiformis TaxID=36881 RepID=A0AAE0BWH6_9CHLO|nr:hypothetical protein CYMTET_46979 [Cymbomonas tetramitiformis]